MKYNYWESNKDERPKELPKYCEVKTTFSRWTVCNEHPNRWGYMQSEHDLCDRTYRWPVTDVNNEND